MKVQPHSVDFYHAVRDSGRDVRELLTESLSRFSTLTEDFFCQPAKSQKRKLPCCKDTAVPIEVSGRPATVRDMASLRELVAANCLKAKSRRLLSRKLAQARLIASLSFGRQTLGEKQGLQELGW